MIETEHLYNIRIIFRENIQVHKQRRTIGAIRVIIIGTICAINNHSVFDTFRGNLVLFKHYFGKNQTIKTTDDKCS